MGAMAIRSPGRGVSEPGAGGVAGTDDVVPFAGAEGLGAEYVAMGAGVALAAGAEAGAGEVEAAGAGDGDVAGAGAGLLDGSAEAAD
jgi:hypothetical protein